MEAIEAAAIEQVRAGDPEAFRVLVERYSRTLFRLAYRMTGHEQDAEDAVQETFLRAYRQIHRFDSRSKFSTWLYAIAVNRTLDLLRGRRRRPEGSAELAYGTAASGDPDPERLAFSGQVQNRVSAALAGLSPAERTAFLLRHFEGLPVAEISRVLGCPDGAARHSVFRAVQKLRRALQPLVGVTP
jgi:RNA polymerase sigma-70 factor (ECF subfamily)